MNEVPLRFYIVKDKKVIDAILDKRLSFNENFILLNELYEIKESNEIYVYDAECNKALLKDIPIKEFNFVPFTNLFIY